MGWYYKGNKLYNIKKLKNDFNYFEIETHWKDSEDDNKEKRGKFRFDQLTET